MALQPKLRPPADMLAETRWEPRMMIICLDFSRWPRYNFWKMTEQAQPNEPAVTDG